MNSMKIKKKKKNYVIYLQIKIKIPQNEYNIEKICFIDKKKFLSCYKNIKLIILLHNIFFVIFNKE